MASNDLSAAQRSRVDGTALACALALLLTACSVSGPRESPINAATRGSPTVLHVYRGQGTVAPWQDASADGPGRRETARELLVGQSTPRPVREADADTQRYWSALEPMRNRFARVPNPELVMVVYPHLSRGKYPVPGYVTAFPMYEQADLYALPGELETELVRRPPAGVEAKGAKP
jgi:conjugative transfer region lipoprotein (TIGR03751 family)